MLSVSAGEPADKDKKQEETPMKKYLVLIAALILMLTSMALADNVPTPHFGTQTET